MTRLLLTMLAGPPGAALASREATESLSIGRGPGNGWVLEDRTLPLPILSRWHCTLHPDLQGWRVEDASGNGTFINDETAPIGKGMSRMLHSGDRLRMGDYVLQAYWAPPPSLQMVGLTSGAADRSSSVSFPHTAEQASLPPDFGMWIEPESALTTEGGSPIQDAWAPQPAIGVLPPDWDQPIEKPLSPVFTGHNGPGELLPADWDQLAEDPPQETPVSTPDSPQAFPQPVADKPMERATTAGSATQAPDLLMAFLRGAGMSATHAAALVADPEAALLSYGATFRALITGVRTVLRSRSAIKREFRITQTLIQADGGNALKLAPSDDKAIEALLAEVRPGRAAAAATEALQDVALHELAMLAAMREAARRMLLSVAPERVQASTSSLDALLPTARKARAYDAYVALHARTVRALDDDFDSTFGREFARAYERLIDDMRARESAPFSTAPLPKDPM